REEGRSEARRGCAHLQGPSAPRWFGYPLRHQRRRPGEQPERADRHPHLRTGSARTPRQEPHEDHLARTGGPVMAARIKKGDKVIVLTGKDKGRTGEVVKSIPDAERVVVSGINMIARHTKPS